MNSVINNSVAVNGSLSFSRCGGCEETLNNCICYIDGDEQIEDDIKHVKSQIHELRYRHRYDFPIKGYGIEQKNIKRWATIHFNDAHQEAKDIKIKDEIFKLNRLMNDNKEYKIRQREKEKNDIIKELEDRVERTIDYEYLLIENEKLKKEKEDLKVDVEYYKKEYEKIDDENTELIGELKETKETLEGDKELIASRCLLEEEIDRLKKEIEEKDYNHSVDANALFKEIIISCNLRKENKKLLRKIRILKIDV